MARLITFSLFAGIIIIVGNFSILPIESKVRVNSISPLKVIDSASEILCSFRTKMIYVYFDNETSLSYPGKILQLLNQCGISHISLRNKYRNAPLESINDDGILMFLVMLMRDASQPIELSIIKKQSAAKHLSHVMLLVADPRNITEHWLQQSFHQFWSIWVLNVVILFWQHDHLQIYRYSPFMPQFLIKLHTDSGRRLPKLLELFPKRIPDMQGRPLRFCMYLDEVRAIFDAKGRVVGGSDGLFLKYLAKSLNASTIVHQVSAFGNKSADVCFNEIRHELDDMALNVRFLSIDTFHRHVESTVVNSRDDLCVLVPKAKTASTFWNLFRSFEVFVWLCVIFSLPLANALCWLLFRGICRTENLLLQLFASTLTMPWTHVPLKFSLRLIMLSWLIYGLLISGAFRGTLTSNLVFRTYLPDINTIQELAMSPYKLLMFSRHSKHLGRYLNNDSVYESMVRQKLTVVPDDVLIERLESNNLTFAYLQKYHLAVYQAKVRRHSRHGRPLYHVMTSCLVPFHAVYIVPYGSPYLGYLNSLIRSAHEFGFIVYWERVTAVDFIKSGKSIVRSGKNGDEDPVVLKLAHFQAAFCLWSMGLSVASFVFLLEHVKSVGFKAFLCHLVGPISGTR